MIGYVWSVWLTEGLKIGSVVDSMVGWVVVWFCALLCG